MKEGIQDDPDSLAKEFLELVKFNVSNYRKKIKELHKNADQFIIQNPFALYYSSAQELREQSNHDLAPTRCFHIASFFLFFSSLEGLINLIYELYLKPELRENRIYEHLRRQELDLKIQLLPIYCEGFRNNILDTVQNSQTFGHHFTKDSDGISLNFRTVFH